MSLPILAVPVIAAAPQIDGTIGTSWDTAATAQLTMDFVNRRPASASTTVRIAQDSSAIDVAFDVMQSEPIVATTVTNGSNVTSDDYVEIALSPNGPLGFQYAFYANARGARYQTSSENSAYAPPWSAVAMQHPGGYSLTMRIPLSIIRSGGRTEWRAQFFRSTVHANALGVWAFNSNALSAGDATFFGTLTGIGTQASAQASRPRARAQFYGVGDLTTKSAGGDTSRAGADLAIPILPTTSLLASFHPDYSNVETDQQSISPTAFPRSYSEVRPFFTQAGQAFNSTFSCNNCPQLLYTPAIPSYRRAYALEGTQGPLTYAAFDALGFNRDDSAETITIAQSDPRRIYQFSAQNVTVNEAGGIRDQITSLSTGYLNVHTHFAEYVNAAVESGSAVSKRDRATYVQGGALYATATTTGVLAWQHIGDQFNPLDAYVPQNDIDGPQFFAMQMIPFKPTTILHDISISTYEADFNNQAKQRSQNDATLQLNVDFKNLLSVHAFYGESAVRTYAGEFLPFDGNGFFVGYKSNTATPTYVLYAGGPYFHGSLDAWTYTTTVPLTHDIRVALETDRNAYYTLYPGEKSGTQWLERASLDFQLNREAQFDVGARRLIGPSLPVSYAPPDGLNFNASNISAAFHYLSRNGRSELYFVYGDPNSLTTTPALVIKYIRYIGSPKGT